MASSRKLLFLLGIVAAAFAFHAAAAAHVPPPPAQKYCADTLAGLKACGSYVFGGAKVPSPACCASYAAVYDSDQSLCLCYVNDGTFWGAVGAGDANATAAAGESRRIPYRCGQAGQPPIDFKCDETAPDDIPPFEPQGTPPAQAPAISGGGAPAARPPSESGPKEIPPPYRPQGTPPAQPPAISGGGGGPPTARPPSVSGPKEILPPYGTQGTPPAVNAGAAGAPAAQPPSAHSVDVGSSTAKARLDSAPELLIMLLVAVAALCLV